MCNSLMRIQRIKTIMIRKLALVSLLSSNLVNVCQASFLPEEIRLGPIKHDIRSGCHHNHEKGYDINAEILWASPDYDILKFIFAPRPHIGTSLNTHGGTNQFYFGITWRFDFLTYLFIEGVFGGDVNSGRKHKKSSRKQALGSKLMFREAVSLGVQFAEHHSLSVMLDHTSNASLGKCNPGLTGLGVRYGYRF